MVVRRGLTSGLCSARHVAAGTYSRVVVMVQRKRWGDAVVASAVVRVSRALRLPPFADPTVPNYQDRGIVGKGAGQQLERGELTSPHHDELYRKI